MRWPLFVLGFIVLLVALLLLYIALTLPSTLPLSDRLQFIPCIFEKQNYERMRCIHKPLDKLVHNNSAQVALDYVFQLQSAGFISECHIPSHWIGEANLSKYNNDVTLAFATCANGCSEGCYHGVIEMYASYVPETTDNVFLCQSLANEGDILYRQCLHGLGHAIMWSNKDSLDTAIEKCESLEDPFAVDTCVGGVQMEFIDQYVSYGEKKFVENISYICEGVEEIYIGECAGSIGYGAMVVTGHNSEKARALCNLLNDDSLISNCVEEVYIEEELNSNDLQAHFKD